VAIYSWPRGERKRAVPTAGAGVASGAGGRAGQPLLRASQNNVPESSRYACEYIVRCQWPPDPLQLELADRLDCDGVLDLRQHARTNEYLSGLGLIAQPRGDVGDSANGGIVEPPLEANSAERREAVRYANPKANLMSPPTPRLGQRSDGLAHF